MKKIVVFLTIAIAVSWYTTPSLAQNVKLTQPDDTAQFFSPLLGKWATENSVVSFEVAGVQNDGTVKVKNYIFNGYERQFAGKATKKGNTIHLTLSSLTGTFKWEMIYYPIFGGTLVGKGNWRGEDIEFKFYRQ